ncbi:MAG TPA: hypothetical protein VGN74_13215 [Brevundimonas sp.]|jgi:anti-sigma factor RsiW|uniref:hypothetical protein n=1 Tax=Brevundimonas sp. TaxID=1871086 RepID=UPI002E13C561|nr:hypothetical protein [Brevundimonas sp.]
MDRTRLGELAEAYGADWRRWPESERDAARALLAADPAAERVLFEARQLDAMLDLAPRLEVTADQRARVIAAAPRPLTGPFARLRAGWRRSGAPGRSVWLSGMGVAAAICAGLLVGEAMVGRVSAGLQAEQVLYLASLDAVDDTEILQ